MKLTQIDRVIKAARSFRGVCQADLLGADVVDGGHPITRLAARIQEAEERGYVFEIIGTRSKCRVYRLAREPDVERTAGNSPDRSWQTTDDGRGVPAARLRDGRKAPAVSGDPGLITRGSTDGSLNAGEQDALFPPEPRKARPHFQDAA